MPSHHLLLSLFVWLRLLPQQCHLSFQRSLQQLLRWPLKIYVLYFHFWQVFIACAALALGFNVSLFASLNFTAISAMSPVPVILKVSSLVHFANFLPAMQTGTPNSSTFGFLRFLLSSISCEVQTASFLSSSSSRQGAHVHQTTIHNVEIYDSKNGP